MHYNILFVWENPISAWLKFASSNIFLKYISTERSGIIPNNFLRPCQNVVNHDICKTKQKYFQIMMEMIPK